MKKHLLLFLFAGILTSCYEAEDPSTIDQKPVDFEGYMDKTVKPGDNFFMYCNGGWWSSTDLGTNDQVGFISDAVTIGDARFKNLSSPAINNFRRSVANFDQTADAALATVRKGLQLVENITTPEDATNALVQTFLAGYDDLTSPLVVFREGKARMLFTFPKGVYTYFNMAELSMTELGMSDVPERLKKAQRLYDHLTNGQLALDVSMQNMLAHPELHDRIVPLIQTRVKKNGILDKLITTLGIDYENVVIDDLAHEFYAKLDQADPSDLQCLLQVYIASEYTFTSRAAYDQFRAIDPETPTFDEHLTVLEGLFMNYTYSHAYAKQYVSEQSKAKIRGYCEEMRVAFGQRIDQLDWMSATTKQKAHEKLDAMIFNIGAPDQWIESALPKLDGASLLENLHTLMQAHTNYLKAIVGKTTQEVSFTYTIISEQTPIHIVNAFYNPLANSMNIMPIWLTEPLYDENMSDAYNYAVFAVLGHEITHGFDSDGAQYNKFGDLENWWTVADQMEFQARQQKLIDCYNLLEILPDELPGVYADGVLTLDENIADLGGVQVAYQAYMTKLLREGYKDEELRKQQHKFFQGFANLWRSKYSTQFALKKRAEDVHSLTKERVNGVVMNMDQWYDLYGVQWGDKLYLKPDRRANIW